MRSKGKCQDEYGKKSVSEPFSFLVVAESESVLFLQLAVDPGYYVLHHSQRTYHGAIYSAEKDGDQ